MEIVTTKITVTTTGADGSATGSGTSEALDGYLLDVYFDFHASAPATTDATLSYATRGGAILTITNSAADVFHAPLKQACDSAAAAISGMYQPYVVADALTVSVAQSNALAPAVTVYVRTLRL